MDGCSHHDLLVQLQLRVKPACKECTLGAQHKASRIERVLHGPVGGCLGYRPELGCRGILPFRKAVDAVVEQYYIDVYVSSYGMDEMVSAYGKRIAVTAGLPHGELRIGHLDAGGYGRGPSMYAVEAVCIHIIRQP